MFKRWVISLGIVVALGAAVFWAMPKVARRILEKKIGEAFPGSQVSIRSCQWLPWRSFNLAGVHVQRAKEIDLEITGISAQYDLTALLGRTISTLDLRGLKINVNAPKKNILDVAGMKSPQNLPAGAAWRLQELILNEANFSINAKDVTVNGRIKGKLDLTQRRLKLLDIFISDLESHGGRLENISLKTEENSAAGEFSIEHIQFNKAHVRNARGAVHFEPGAVSLDVKTAEAFGGRIKGGLALRGFPDVEYMAHLEAADVNLGGVVNDFELDEKFQLSGVTAGQILLSGDGPEMQVLKGNFSVGKQGGVLTIKDARLLENMARGSNQPIDIIVESLREYRYNSGTFNASLEGDDILLEMALDGDAGKRNLIINLHDVRPKKEEGL